jgi:two-component system OmpR family sensor kinase
VSVPVQHVRPAPKLRRAVTLRTKLIASIVVLIIALSVIIGVTTEIFLSKYLVQQLDNRLQSSFAPRGDRNFGAGPGATGSTGQPNDPGAANTTPERLSTVPYECPTNAAGTAFTGTADDVLFALVQDGQLTRGAYRTSATTCHQLTAADATDLVNLTAADGIQTLTIGPYGSFRVVAKKPNSSGQVQVTAASLSDVTADQRKLAEVMALVAGGAIILGGLLTFVIVSRSVRPLERVAETARKVATLPLDKGEVDLAIRVPAKDTDPRTEIGSVGAAINQMLGHVSGALTARHASETRVRQFVADASHELRTPLAAIRGYAELARRGEHEPGAVAHALRRVESESERMTTLVDDLLLLARLDSGRPLDIAEVDLTMLAVDRVSDARVAGPDHRWQLDLPDEPVTVIGDGARLHQVLANLLANARNHTPPGTIVVTGVRREIGGAVLTVTDNGPGIPQELQPEIFGRFVRGDSSRSRAAGSTGLGLAIVAAVISAHGGTVTVESRPGRTSARVWLPDHIEFPSAPVDPLPATSGSPSLSGA